MSSIRSKITDLVASTFRGPVQTAFAATGAAQRGERDLVRWVAGLSSAGRLVYAGLGRGLPHPHQGRCRGARLPRQPGRGAAVVSQRASHRSGGGGQQDLVLVVCTGPLRARAKKNSPEANSGAFGPTRRSVLDWVWSLRFARRTFQGRVLATNRRPRTHGAPHCQRDDRVPSSPAS